MGTRYHGRAGWSSIVERPTHAPARARAVPCIGLVLGAAVLGLTLLTAISPAFYPPNYFVVRESAATRATKWLEDAALSGAPSLLATLLEVRRIQGLSARFSMFGCAVFAASLALSASSWHSLDGGSRFRLSALVGAAPLALSMVPAIPKLPAQVIWASGALNNGRCGTALTSNNLLNHWNLVIAIELAFFFSGRFDRARRSHPLGARLIKELGVVVVLSWVVSGTIRTVLAYPAERWSHAVSISAVSYVLLFLIILGGAVIVLLARAAGAERRSCTLGLLSGLTTLRYGYVWLRLGLTALAIVAPSTIARRTADTSACPAWMLEDVVAVPEELRGQSHPAGLSASNPGHVNIVLGEVWTETVLCSSTSLFLVFLGMGMIVDVSNQRAERKAEAARASSDLLRSAIAYISHEARGPLNAAVLGLALLDDMPEGAAPVRQPAARVRSGSSLPAVAAAEGRPSGVEQAGSVHPSLGPSPEAPASVMASIPTSITGQDRVRPAQPAAQPTPQSVDATAVDDDVTASALGPAPHGGAEDPGSLEDEGALLQGLSASVAAATRHLDDLVAWEQADAADEPDGQSMEGQWADPAELLTADVRSQFALPCRNNGVRLELPVECAAVAGDGSGVDTGRSSVLGLAEGMGSGTPSLGLDSGELMQVYTDFGRLAGVVSNGVSNALKHVPAQQGGSITVHIGLSRSSGPSWMRPKVVPPDLIQGHAPADGGEPHVSGQSFSPRFGSSFIEHVARGMRRGVLLLSVRDNGPGIPHDLLHSGKLFQPFARLRQGDDSLRMASSGLGLAIVRSIVVEYLGGEVGLGSREGGGAELYARVPVWYREEAVDTPGPRKAGEGQEWRLEVGAGAQRVAHGRHGRPHSAGRQGEAGTSPFRAPASRRAISADTHAASRLNPGGAPAIRLAGATPQGRLSDVTAAVEAASKGGASLQPPAATASLDATAGQPSSTGAETRLRMSGSELRGSENLSSSRLHGDVAGNAGGSGLAILARGVTRSAPDAASSGRPRLPPLHHGSGSAGNVAQGSGGPVAPGPAAAQASPSTRAVRGRLERDARRKARRQARGSGKHGTAKACGLPASCAGRVAFVVDDERVNRTLTAALLRRWGLEVRAFADGAQAVDALRAALAAGEGVPGVMTLDVEMPVLDGKGVLRAMGGMDWSGATGSSRRPGVIVVTGNARRHDRDELLGLGAGAVLAKPVDPAALSKLVSSALRHSATG